MSRSNITLRSFPLGCSYRARKMKYQQIVSVKQAKYFIYQINRRVWQQEAVLDHCKHDEAIQDHMRVLEPIWVDRQRLAAVIEDCSR